MVDLRKSFGTNNAANNNFNRNQGDKGKKNAGDDYLINNRITYPAVRVVGDNVEQGIYDIKDAIKLSDKMGLDLILISESATPPVCKIADYQKFLYEQKKREKEKKAKTVKTEVKEIRLGPNTDDHDFEFKKNHAIRFLQAGNKVKVEVFFRGRAIAYKEQGEIMLLKFAEQLQEYGKVEQMPKLEGKRMHMSITPLKQKK